MFRQFIDKVAQADLYMITSFLIFFFFFIGVGIMLLRAKKEHINELKQIPLKPDTIHPNQQDEL